LALTSSSLASAAVVDHPHTFTPSFIIPPYHATAPTLTDAQLVANASSERAALAAKARATARAAAAAAARRAAASRVSAHAAYSSSGSINVWTTGFQTQINECRGAVDLTAHYYTRTIGEHWSCGGASFPKTAGAIVHITGLDAGTYRVIGLVATLNAYVAHTSSIPKGYQLLFQTCRNGDSHYTIFIALERA
jgi:hypothetical protein